MKNLHVAKDETTLQLIAQSIVGVDLSYEPAMRCEDIIIINLMENDGEYAETCTVEDIREILGLTRVLE